MHSQLSNTRVEVFQLSLVHQAQEPESLPQTHLCAWACIDSFDRLSWSVLLRAQAASCSRTTTTTTVVVRPCQCCPPPSTFTTSIGVLQCLLRWTATLLALVLMLPDMHLLFNFAALFAEMPCSALPTTRPPFKRMPVLRYPTNVTALYSRILLNETCGHVHNTFPRC